MKSQKENADRKVQELSPENSRIKSQGERDRAYKERMTREIGGNPGKKVNQKLSEEHSLQRGQCSTVSDAPDWLNNLRIRN